MPGKRARRHFSQLSEFERGLNIGMKTAGWSTRRVAGQVDCSEKTTRREDRAASTVDPTVTRSTIRADVGVAIVPQTIFRHLAEENLKSKRPFRALPLTPEHRQLRLQWCQARSMWNVTDCQKVVFSDESRFVLGTDDNRVRVRRHPGPFLNGLPGAIFQQDNACLHTARVAQDFLRHFQTVPWPARSPDLSPVEHVWDQLKRQMPSCHSVQDLELAVQDLWVHLPQDIRSPVAGWLVHHASTPQVRGSNPELGKIDSAFHPFSGSIKRAPSLLDNLTLGVSRQTDHLTRTSAHAPQGPRSCLLR
ncbi:transposable element Tcb2 transposase [Trichonephila clavipes]|nr:transposable element Tcb2 transposase [Trichonephila clavipes]